MFPNISYQPISINHGPVMIAVNLHRISPNTFSYNNYHKMVYWYEYVDEPGWISYHQIVFTHLFTSCNTWSHCAGKFWKHVANNYVYGYNAALLSGSPIPGTISIIQVSKSSSYIYNWKGERRNATHNVGPRMNWNLISINRIKVVQHIISTWEQ